MRFFLSLSSLTFFFFPDDKKKGIVPDSFPRLLDIGELIKTNFQDETQATLLSSYRTSLSDDFYYFVTRLLSGVNASITNFESKKTHVLLSEIFTVSDEAYALVTILNSLHVWEEQMKDKADRDPKRMKRKYTLPKSGRKESWSTEGRNAFHILCRKIEILRKDEMTGRTIEESLRNKFREESVQFKEQMKTTPLMEKEVEEEYYMDENLKNMLQFSGV